MSDTPEPRSVEERLEDIDGRLRELDSSRRWHFWVLVLLVFTTCGYGTVDTTSNNSTGISNDVGALRRNVRELSQDVERLSDEVERLRDELNGTQEVLQRVADSQR